MAESPQNEQTLLRMLVAMPRVGEQARFVKGPLELLLENHKGGLCVLTPHPRHPRRHFLGLPKEGSLELAVHAPEYRIRVHLEDRLTLAPGGRLRGYLTVPMPHRLLWRRPNGGVEPLLDLSPKELRTSWLGEGPDGGYVHDAPSAFHIDRHELRAETVAIVPVVIWNHGDHVISPENLTISIRERDIREVDGQVVIAPRRLHFGESGMADERIRSLPRRSA